MRHPRQRAHPQDSVPLHELIVNLEEMTVVGMWPRRISEIAALFDIDLRGSHQFISSLVAVRSA
jgi:hypothetical protein